MKIDSFRGVYFFLSNFYEASVTVDGLTYKNNEAAFQAYKLLEVEKRVKFTEVDPSRAKQMGRNVQLRRDWEDIKYDAMYNCVKAKFEQNPDLAEKLIATGDAYLEEGNTWGDRIWGTVNGIGQNHLGKILMRVRQELQESKSVGGFYL